MSYIVFSSYKSCWSLLVLAVVLLDSVGFRISAVFSVFIKNGHLCMSVGLLVLGLPPPTSI